MKRTGIYCLAGLLLMKVSRADEEALGGWLTCAPRDEIRPAFSFDPAGGPKRAGSWVITHDRREGLSGWFQKAFAVTGGEYVCFHDLSVALDVEVRPVPRKEIVIRFSDDLKL